MIARVLVLAALFALGQGVAPVAAQTAPDHSVAGNDAGLQNWLVDFRPRALDEGIRPDVFDAAIKGITYDENVIRRDRNQSEFTKTIWEYLETATSDLRIANGKAALERQSAALAEIEAQYGVDKEVVVAIWGLESAYGTFRGRDGVIGSLASLAYDGRRQAFFEAELLEALRILQAGDTSPAKMTGSWAGAMGHTQFMPSSFQRHAVDFTKDGKRDIWGDDPRDALASTAAYLKHFGWTYQQPWGVEVTLPDGFDYLLADREILKTPAEWAGMGITDMSGDTVPNHGPASILLPGGAEGAAFMVFSNFAVIERYNTADAYVIGVGHLSDRIVGGPPIAHGWPLQDRALTYDERIELQTQLTALGFDTVKIDAKIGPLTINAVRNFQTAQGLLPDGYASLRLLERVRAAR
ncbi:lytic murein transglycosylase [Sulfitobacter sp.]|jgi:lytic murein transglycosylase|uniref:lytic murein transglycosylase n=1 Tax=Sulfitobacter sp. TaxID=1903071 RepID=UPI0039E51D46